MTRRVQSDDASCVMSCCTAPPDPPPALELCFAFFFFIYMGCDYVTAFGSFLLLNEIVLAGAPGREGDPGRDVEDGRDA